MVLLAHFFVDEARSSLVKVEQLDPRNPRWPYYQGVLLFEGDPDAAIVKLERAVDLCGDDPAAPRLRLAEVLLGQGRIDDADGQFQRSLKKHPQNARAQLGLARIALSRGDFDGTLGHGSLALADEHSRKPAQLLLAQTHRRLGNENAAREQARLAAQERDPSPWPDPFVEEVERLHTGRKADQDRAANFLRQGRVPEAVALLRNTVRDYPDADRAWVLLGQALLRDKDLAGAERALRSAVRLAPASAEAQFYLGYTLHFSGDLKEASSYIRRAIELKSHYAEAYYTLGHCLMKLGDSAGAIDAFRSAARLKPDIADTHKKLAELLSAAGDDDAAVTHLQHAIRLDPTDTASEQLLQRIKQKQSLGNHRGSGENGGA
jgi:tetratricopeptide (TPR) repeat protein